MSEPRPPARFARRDGFEIHPSRGLPAALQPIDLEIDHITRTLYWTDRGDPPLGNTVNRAALADIGSTAPEIVATHLMEGIGIALDPAHDRMFVTDLAGTIYVAALDGSGHRPIRVLQGNLTGIAYAELPTRTQKG